MQVDDPARDGVVGDLVALVDENEEEIEATHDRRRHVDVLLERLAAVVASAHRVRRRQDRRARVQCRLFKCRQQVRSFRAQRKPSKLPLCARLVSGVILR